MARTAGERVGSTILTVGVIALPQPFSEGVRWMGGRPNPRRDGSRTAALQWFGVGATVIGHPEIGVPVYLVGKAWEMARAKQARRVLQ